MPDNYPSADDVDSRETFVRFVDGLIADLEQNPDGWENPTLDRYLGALASWTTDMDGYFKNQGLEMPKSVDWNLFAAILAAAKVYE